MKQAAVIAVIALAAAAGGAWFALDRQDEPATEARATEPPAYRPDFSLPDLDGTVRAFSEWDGTPTIVNFWATWCAPCRREIPVLMALKAEHGDSLAVLGVAIDDADAVRSYVEEMGFNYPTLVGQLDAIEVAREFGNHIGALPFTAIVAADGRIHWSHAGEVDAGMLDEALAEL